MLSVGAKFLYVIPGFDVLGVELWHIQVKGFSKIGNPDGVFDIFIKIIFGYVDCTLQASGCYNNQSTDKLLSMYELLGIITYKQDDVINLLHYHTIN